MKVASVEVFRVDMPMRGFYKNAFHNHNVQPCCLVRLRADDGFEGVGDVEPFRGYSSGGRDETADAIERVLGPALLGADPKREGAAAPLLHGDAHPFYHPKSP